MPDDKALKQLRVPLTAEVAKPDNQLRNISYRVSDWIDLLAPEDDVITGLGGIDSLFYYKELLRDDQVHSTFQQRRLRVISTETVVDAGGDGPLDETAADAFREQMVRLRWDDIFDKSLYTLFYGWGINEIMWAIEGDQIVMDRIIVRERKRFRFNSKNELFLIRAGVTDPIPMPDRKFWVMNCGADNDDEPYGMGLARSLYWPVFFKRNDIKFWLYFLEKYGQPTVLAKANRATLDDPVSLERLLATLQAIASDVGVAVPNDAEFEFLEASRSSTADYSELQDKMDAAISKIVLSQTMTTDDGSSRSQSQTHENVADKVIKSDADLVCESFMRGPLKWWTEWNFPGAATPRIWRNTEPPEDLNVRAERDKIIVDCGFEMTEEYVEEQYGDGFVKKEEPEPPAIGAMGIMPNQQQAANFAESDVARLKRERDAVRGDQDQIVRAALNAAEDYEVIIGQQIGGMLKEITDATSFEDAQIALRELAAEIPPASTVDKLDRATIGAELLGAYRAQKQ